MFHNLKFSIFPFRTPASPEDIFMADILDKNTSEVKHPEMLAARRSEIKNLLKRGNFKVILKDD